MLDQELGVVRNPALPVLGRLRQEDHLKLEGNLGYLVSSRVQSQYGLHREILSEKQSKTKQKTPKQTKSFFKKDLRTRLEQMLEFMVFTL